MRWGAGLATITLLASAAVAIELAPPPLPARATSAEALLVGDSVMNGLAQGYATAARASLAARHSYILDTAGCRRLITTSCSIGDGPRPSNALSVVQSRAGQYDRTLVIAVGYNDPADRHGQGSGRRSTCWCRQRASRASTTSSG